jgi:hypothetical protein
MIMKVFWSLNLVPTHWAPIFIRMCHNNPVCWFDWPLVPMLKGVTVQHFFDHSFHRTSNRIETTCIIGHFTHFVGCWKFTQHYKGELTVRLVKDMSSITRTHSLLPKILGSAEPAVTPVALDDGSGSEVSECLRNQAHSDHSDSSI